VQALELDLAKEFGLVLEMGLALGQGKEEGWVRVLDVKKAGASAQALEVELGGGKERVWG
jgi:hypothetical protein